MFLNISNVLFLFLKKSLLPFLNLLWVCLSFYHRETIPQNRISFLSFPFHVWVCEYVLVEVQVDAGTPPPLLFHLIQWIRILTEPRIPSSACSGDSPPDLQCWSPLSLGISCEFWVSKLWSQHVSSKCFNRGVALQPIILFRDSLPV